MEIYGLSFIYEWLEKNSYVLLYLGIFSFCIFFISIFGIKYFAAKIPKDYFTNKQRVSRLKESSLALWLVYIVIKNFIGYIFIIFGILALVLPGQGILMILIGLVMSDYPRKQNLERRIISIKTVRRGVNWLRKKSGVEEIEFK
ncbi:MAG: PGPGW domain-containing protein [Gammaproteobacteria bacterium]|uniref:Uncharacterized protein n=1 Tax=SAR86 cluster bacterium TaxID=2030880 RepID=A0A838YXV4_9GAMM|nr:hypothetical protein [SAR86 cluster bacterium]|tara:strand:- start:130 stop:561 length:432 start_codon:yes stop_codon:yes gene_type:complete